MPHIKETPRLATTGLREKRSATTPIFSSLKPAKSDCQTHPPGRLVDRYGRELSEYVLTNWSEAALRVMQVRRLPAGGAP